MSEWASKLTNKLDFGYQHVGHNHYSWLHAKLKNTRVFDDGVVKEYLDLLRMPYFEFSEEENHSIVTALLGQTAQKIAAPTSKHLSSREFQREEAHRLIHKYNCQGCHVAEEMFESLSDDHPDYSKHEDEKFLLEGRIKAYYKDEQEAYGPPAIATENGRARSSWVHSFLNDPSRVIRPKLKVRMPTFQLSNDEVNTIVTGWAQDAGQEFPVSPLKSVQLSTSQVADAKKMFDKLQCTMCHTVGREANAAELADLSVNQGLAPNLSRSYGRLRKEWIVEFLKNPAKMVPGTMMPSFWTDGQSQNPEVLGGDAQKQMELMADYVLWLGQGSTPSPKVSLKISPQLIAHKKMK